ncbi:MAG: hypothetical protein U0359_30005 [Byssovorax sp.]
MGTTGTTRVNTHIVVHMIELSYIFERKSVSQKVRVRLSDVKQVRASESTAPWDISLTIVWGEEIAFDRPLAGADPLHAVKLAAQFAATYLHGRAQDEGGVLNPPIVPTQTP